MPRRKIPSDYVRLNIRIHIPREWREKINKYMEEHGFLDLSDLVIHLLREHVIKGAGE